jgi:hypothetical protein
MNWDRVETSWKRLKEATAFVRRRLTNRAGKRLDSLGVETPSDGQGSDPNISAFRPDDHGRRSEFSLHIGC